MIMACYTYFSSWFRIKPSCTFINNILIWFYCFKPHIVCLHVPKKAVCKLCTAQFRYIADLFHQVKKLKNTGILIIYFHIGPSYNHPEIPNSCVPIVGSSLVGVHLINHRNLRCQSKLVCKQHPAKIPASVLPIHKVLFSDNVIHRQHGSKTKHGLSWNIVDSRIKSFYPAVLRQFFHLLAQCPFLHTRDSDLRQKDWFIFFVVLPQVIVYRLNHRHCPHLLSYNFRETVLSLMLL